MKQILNMYRMVKIAQEKSIERDLLNEDLAREHEKNFDEIMDNMNPLVGDVKSEYRNRYNVKASTVNGVFDDCTNKKWNYLDTKTKAFGNVQLPWYVIVSPEGRSLTDTIPYLPFYPKGLIRALWQDDKVTIKLAIALFTGSLGYILTHVIAWLAMNHLISR